jgi:tetratricopeptide (TPR) repeat protein
MHWATILGFILIITGGIFQIYGGWKSDSVSENKLTGTINSKNNKIDQLSDSNAGLTKSNMDLISQNTEMLSKSQDIQIGNSELLSKNIDLLQRIENYQIQVEEKNKKIEALEKHVKTVGRGTMSSIQFGGSYLDKSGGGIRLISGTDEEKAYKSMLNAQENKDWAELLVICENQIKISPTWITSYFYKSIALFNTGDKKTALNLLKYVEKETPGDAAYVLNLALLYEQLGEKEKADELRATIPKEQLYKFNSKK